MEDPTAIIIWPDCELDGAEVDDGVMTLKARSKAQAGACPSCGKLSTRVHSYYTRTIRDLPFSEYAVWLKLCVRRFRCLNPACQRQTFTEQLPRLAAPYAQRTHQLKRTLNEVGCYGSSEAGSRLLEKLRMKVSGDTLLRLLRKATLPEVGTPRVLSIDDWAQRKGRTYGTILVDLERHQVVDLLPDRTATTLADWLQAHPGIEIIVRDRSTEYARGASEGAPNARQVADRWHLLLNLRQVLERYLTQAYARLKQLPRLVVDAAASETESCVPRRLPCAPTRNERCTSQASRERRMALYESVQAMKADGQPILRISQQLNLHRATVRKYYYADSFPERSQRKLRPSILDPYLSYLEKRLHEGCENASQLWREICAQGYPGTRSQVYKWIQGKRTQPAPSTPKRYFGEAQVEERRELKRLRSTRGIPSVKQLAWLLTKKAEELSGQEHRLLAWVRQDGLVAAVNDLAQQFAMMVRERQAQLLDTWLAACTVTGISNLITFAAGIQQDYLAVQAALSTVWSNGQAEGHVNRLKLVKRQMYGRASFDLLRARVLSPS